jgi:hypothetical protein
MSGDINMETAVQSGSQPMVGEVTGKFQLSQEERETIAAGRETRACGVPGIGVVLITLPSKDDQLSFRTNAMGKGVERHDKDNAFEALARASIIWPPLKDLDAELDQTRKYMALIQIGAEASQLAGMDTDKVDRRSAPQVEGRFKTTAEALDKLFDENEGLDLQTCLVPGVGVVVLWPASRPNQQRFRKKTMGKDVAKYDRAQALAELGRCSVIWPPVPELDEEIALKRRHLAWVQLGAEASALAGMATEAIEGN